MSSVPWKARGRCTARGQNPTSSSPPTPSTPLSSPHTPPTCLHSEKRGRRPGVGLVLLGPGPPGRLPQPPRLFEGRQIFHNRVRLVAGGQARPHRIKSGCVALVRGPTFIEIKISEHTEPRVP